MSIEGFIFLLVSLAIVWPLLEEMERRIGSWWRNARPI